MGPDSFRTCGKKPFFRTLLTTVRSSPSCIPTTNSSAVKNCLEAPEKLHLPLPRKPFSAASLSRASLRLLIHQYRWFRHLRHQPWLRRPMAPTNMSLCNTVRTQLKLNQSHSQRTSTMPCFERFNGAARAFGTFDPNYGQLGGESKFLFAAVWFISHCGGYVLPGVVVHVLLRAGFYHRRREGKGREEKGMPVSAALQLLLFLCSSSSLQPCEETTPCLSSIGAGCGDDARAHRRKMTTTIEREGRAGKSGEREGNRSIFEGLGVISPVNPSMDAINSDHDPTASACSKKRRFSAYSDRITAL